MLDSVVAPSASVLERVPALKAEFEQRRRITIADLLAADVAERIADELLGLPYELTVNAPMCGETCDCAPHWHYSVVVESDARGGNSPLRSFVHSAMRGPVRDLIVAITGLDRLRDRPRRGRPGLVAHAFPKGGFVEPHTDSFDRVGFVFHLTRHWEPGWGGALRFTEAAGESHLPSFGALQLFELTPHNRHEVTMVTGPEVRYTLIGRLRESRW